MANLYNRTPPQLSWHASNHVVVTIHNTFVHINHCLMLGIHRVNERTGAVNELAQKFILCSYLYQ